MGVSVTGASGRSLARMRTAGLTLGLLGGAAFYLYGPPVTPALHGAAAAECNDLAGGNYRSYRLEWVTGTPSHWQCFDRSEPAQKPVDMGWWVTPGF